MRRAGGLALIVCIFTFGGLSVSRAQSGSQSQFKDASSELVIPTEAQLFKDDPDPVVLSAQIAVRLKKIQHIIPLDYNDHVQKYISYNTNERRREHISKMLARAKKFFPIFEPILSQYGVPDEMKYLAVVESALNPFAVSPKGASGLWQFMYSTGMRYDLNISRRVDERRDPYKACEGAARYLKEMYDLYGNWQLAIASYNCGAGNVNRAIKKAGGSTNFWDIRPYLPAETQAYVPTFIAMVYAMKYAKQYGISPLNTEWEATQRVTVRDKIRINDLESLLGVPRQVIIDENPALLTTLIPANFTLNLPASRVQAFTQFQDSLYEKAEGVTIAQKLIVPRVLKPESSPKESPQAATAELLAASGDDYSTQPIVKGKKTKQDKNTDPGILQKIKKKFLPAEDEGANPENPKSAAKAKSESHPAKGRKPNTPATASASRKNDNNPPLQRRNELIKEDDDNYRAVVYKVRKGDNLGYIASWFHCRVREVRRWNELGGNFIDVDDELLIYVHTNDYKKFVRFNYLSNRLKDLLSSKITTQEEADALRQKEAAKDSSRLIDKINPAKLFSGDQDCYQTHKVKYGENLWTIAQKYDDVTVQDLMHWNGYKKTPVLHKGQLIKVRKIPCS